MTTEDQLVDIVQRMGEKIEEQWRRIAALAGDLDACVKECTELEARNSTLTAQVERLMEGISTIGQIRRSNLYQTCIDCDGDRCGHGANRDLIMQQVTKLLNEKGSE